MPGVLHFWQGAITYDAYWDMPHDQLEQLMRYQRDRKPGT